MYLKTPFIIKYLQLL